MQAGSRRRAGGGQVDDPGRRDQQAGPPLASSHGCCAGSAGSPAAAVSGFGGQELAVLSRGRFVGWLEGPGPEAVGGDRLGQHRRSWSSLSRAADARFALGPPPPPLGRPWGGRARGRRPACSCFIDFVAEKRTQLAQPVRSRRNRGRQTPGAEVVPCLKISTTAPAQACRPELHLVGGAVPPREERSVGVSKRCRCWKHIGGDHALLPPGGRNWAWAKRRSAQQQKKNRIVALRRWVAVSTLPYLNLQKNERRDRQTDRPRRAGAVRGR